MRNIICLFMFLSMLLGGCQSAATIADITPTATANPTPKPADSRLSLEPCRVANNMLAAQCGTLHVPEDRSNPNGRILDLGIVVVPARGSDKAPDPLFYIAGGPGDAATNPDIVINATTLFGDININRDIIYLDQRGSNGKNRLTCEYPDFSIRDAPQQQVDDWMEQCLSGLEADPRFYTTAEAMRDLDEARDALGYDQINLYGISYGASAIQVYMRMFPEHVRAAVLDHGTALDLPFFQAYPRASQSALEQIFSYCEQDEKCHAAFPDIRGDWQAILDRLAQEPVIANLAPPGETTPVQVTVAVNDLADAIHNLMFKSGTYMQIPFLIHMLATHEDWTEILKSYAEQQGSSEWNNTMLVMKDMIFCFEPAWGEQPEAIARLNPGSYILDLTVTNAQFEQKICAALPKPESSSIYAPGKPAPLSALMLNSLIDPQNPPSNMDLALKEFTHSRVVVEPTEGHDTSASGCRWGIITQYIQQGSVDALDLSCMENQKPTFVVGGG
jgi:pimeloyl-ACP methyl ester carboxylesterase